ncbi:MAG: TonB family protein [Bacteroidia bacterium]
MKTTTSTLKKAAYGILLFTGLYSIPASAQVEDNGDKTLSPYFYVPGSDGSTDDLPLLKTSADVNIAGVIAGVKVTQVYKNSGTKAIEAIYIFPGSTRAAVYDMRMIIGKRCIQAKIDETEKARKTYEDAKQEGKTASLLEQQRPNVFQMNVANLMPGDTIKVELYYTELLEPENGEYSFVYPTVVGPRYSNQLVASANPKDLWVANPYTKEGVKPSYQFDIRTSINAGMPLQEVLCTSHEVNINFDGMSSASINLKESEKFRGNKDYILKYRLAGKKVENGLLLYQGEKENFFLIMMQPPKVVNKTEIPAREYIFIVDVSGSMNGFPLETSKELLKNLIGGLNPTDKFNVILFAGAANIWQEESQSATADNIDKAIKHINEQRGGGGTELLPALKKALAVNTDDKYARTFVIATDGYVSCEKEAFDLIRNSLSTANFFSFGIGSSVNRYLIEGMAYAGMGEPYVITKPEEAAAAGLKFKNYIEHPLLTNIKIDYKGLNVYDVEPLSIPDIFSERPVIVFGKYKGNASGNISISGINGGGAYTASLNVSEYKAMKENAPLRYLWARHRIKNLDYYSKMGAGEAVKKEVTKLGLDYNLLTAYTSFVAVDNQVRNEGGQNVPVHQALPLPEGVSNYAVAGTGSVTYNWSTTNGATSNHLNSGYFSSPHADKKRKIRSYAPSYGSGKGKLEESEKKTMPDSVSGTAGDKGAKEQPLLSAEIMPAYIGGETALQKFIKDNMNYPLSAKKNGIEGTVYLQFVVDKTGRIRNIKILKGVNKELNEEALRIVKLMPQWTAGMQSGKNADVQYSLPVKFKLN